MKNTKIKIWKKLEEDLSYISHKNGKCYKTIKPPIVGKIIDKGKEVRVYNKNSGNYWKKITVFQLAHSKGDIKKVKVLKELNLSSNFQSMLKSGELIGKECEFYVAKQNNYLMKVVRSKGNKKEELI